MSQYGFGIRAILNIFEVLSRSHIPDGFFSVTRKWGRRRADLFGSFPGVTLA